MKIVSDRWWKLWYACRMEKYAKADLWNYLTWDDAGKAPPLGRCDPPSPYLSISKRDWAARLSSWLYLLRQYRDRPCPDSQMTSRPHDVDGVWDKFLKLCYKIVSHQVVSKQRLRQLRRQEEARKLEEAQAKATQEIRGRALLALLAAALKNRQLQTGEEGAEGEGLGKCADKCGDENASGIESALDEVRDNDVAAVAPAVEIPDVGQEASKKGESTEDDDLLDDLFDLDDSDVLEFDDTDSVASQQKPAAVIGVGGSSSEEVGASEGTRPEAIGGRKRSRSPSAEPAAKRCPPSAPMPPRGSRSLEERLADLKEEEAAALKKGDFRGVLQIRRWVAQLQPQLQRRSGKDE